MKKDGFLLTVFLIWFFSCEWGTGLSSEVADDIFGGNIFSKILDSHQSAGGLWQSFLKALLFPIVLLERRLWKDQWMLMHKSGVVTVALFIKITKLLFSHHKKRTDREGEY